jgi:hypothetical protein
MAGLDACKYTQVWVYLGSREMKKRLIETAKHGEWQAYIPGL